MTTFIRVPLAYWADRIGMPILFGGIGIFICTLVLVNGRDDLGSLEAILSLVLGAALVIAGIFFYFRHSLPVRIEVDAKDVRVFYIPEKMVNIPRKNVILARGSSNGMYGGTSNSIVYRKDGAIKHANIMAWYRSEKGAVLPRNDINTALNSALNISNLDIARIESRL